jgi:hypothetical protein
MHKKQDSAALHGHTSILQSDPILPGKFRFVANLTDKPAFIFLQFAKK